jgi:hypothetical protein
LYRYIPGHRRIYVDGQRVAADLADAQYLLAGDFTLGGVGPEETFPREELFPDAGCAAGRVGTFHSRHFVVQSKHIQLMTAGSECM